MTSFRHLIPHSSVPISLNGAKCNLDKVKLMACISACFDTVGAPHSLQGHFIAWRVTWHPYVLSHALSCFTTLIPSPHSSLVSIKNRGSRYVLSIDFVNATGSRWWTVVGLPWLPPGHVQWRAGMTTFRHLIPHSSVPMSLTDTKGQHLGSQHSTVNSILQPSFIPKVVEEKLWFL